MPTRIIKPRNKTTQQYLDEIDVITKHLLDVVFPKYPGAAKMLDPSDAEPKYPGITWGVDDTTYAQRVTAWREARKSWPKSC